MARPKYPSDEIDKTMVRFPPGLMEKVREAAAANNRSMNAEIITRLEDTFGGIRFTLPTDMQRRLRVAAEANHRQIADELWHGLRTLYPAPKEMSVAEFEEIYMRFADNLPQEDREGAVEWLRWLKPRLIAKSMSDGVTKVPAKRQSKRPELPPIGSGESVQDHIANMEEQGKVKRLRSEYLTDEEKVATRAKRKIRSDKA